jgi:hypothetical protein
MLANSFVWSLLLVAVVTTGVAAQEGPDWVAAQFLATGVDANTVATFEMLLQDELRERMRVPVRPSGEDEYCGDPLCAGSIGKREGAAVVVYGSVATLGADILVRVGFLDVKSGQSLSTHKMTVDRIEDLALVAERIAKAVAGEGTVESTAALGNVTAREVPPARRREGERGLALHFAGIAPLGMSYADTDFGVDVGLSYWFETNDFVIEPRIGFRFSANRDTDNGGVFSEVPFEVAGYYLFTRTDIAPFLGASLGARYGWEEALLTTKTDATVFEEETVEKITRQGWGFGGTARVGLLLMRTYAMRVAVSLDYGIGYMEQIHTSVPQSLTFGVSAMF